LDCTKIPGENYREGQKQKKKSDGGEMSQIRKHWGETEGERDHLKHRLRELERGGEKAGRKLGKGVGVGLIAKDAKKSGHGSLELPAS